MSKIKIAVLGAGRIGILHIENILNHFQHLVEIKYVIDNFISPTNKKWVLKNRLHLIEDPQKAFSDPEVTAVVIASPTHTHADYIIQAAQKGKHIFCEKPIDLIPKNVIKALQIVKKNLVHLQVGFNRRYDKNFLKLKKMLTPNFLKNLRFLKITSRDPAPPSLDYLKSSGGIFIDMAIHDFDMINFLIPNKVVQVSALGSAIILPELKKFSDVDVAITNLIFDNGMIATIDNSREAIYGYDQRIEILGKDGLLVAENEKNTTVQLFTKKEVKHDVPPWFFLERYQKSYIEGLGYFFTTINNPKNQTLLNGENGLTALLIALAAKKSLKEKRIVSVKEITNE